MKDFDHSRMKCDAAAVAGVMELMETMINPFDYEYEALKEFEEAIREDAFNSEE